MIWVELYHPRFYGRHRPDFNSSRHWSPASKEVPVQAQTDCQSRHLLFHACCGAHQYLQR